MHASEGEPVAAPVRSDLETRTLIQQLDRAVSRRDPNAICEDVKHVLIDAAFEIPPEYAEPAPEGYARRLLHHCPQWDYSVMVMVWGPGQGTPIHDHAGKWCVECVMKGRIEITSYTPTTDPAADVVQFDERDTVAANLREVGILVPPNEYHRIRNVSDETAVTVHVYQGEMLWCHQFHPLRRGGYRRERCTLSYTRGTA
jgi:predicted metal-dependent enzyme (double-stranded beta helix superfamily)